MKFPHISRFIRLIVALVIAHGFIGLIGINAYAGCSVHDHNCRHGSFPFDPNVGPAPTGSGDLTFNTTWMGEADVNQHVATPLDAGPHVGSNPDGNPVEATPLGGGPNVIYSGQQTVQYQNGTAVGTLTSSPDAENGGGARAEKTVITGNVASGEYQTAIYNYNVRENTETGAFTTTITAGNGGYFEDAPSHVATGYNRELSFSGNLSPDQVSEVVKFNYRFNNFDPHANGVYVIPDGVWNIGGIPSNPQISQPYQFEFANINLGQDEVAVDFLNNVMGLSQAAGQEFGGWIYNADNGGFGLSLSVGNAAKVDIYTPDNALSQLGKGLNDTTAMWHTHVNRNDSSASLADTYIAGHFERDSYIASHATNATVINKLDTHTIAERASSGRINTSNLSIGANITSQQLSNGNRIVNVSTANGDYSVAALANAGYVYGSAEGLEGIKDELSDDALEFNVELEANPREGLSQESLDGAVRAAENEILGLPNSFADIAPTAVITGILTVAAALGKYTYGLPAEYVLTTITTEIPAQAIANITARANERSVYAADQKAIAEDAPSFLPGGRWSREAEFDRELAETAAENARTGPRGADAIKKIMTMIVKTPVILALVALVEVVEVVLEIQEIGQVVIEVYSG